MQGGNQYVNVFHCYLLEGDTTGPLGTVVIINWVYFISIRTGQHYDAGQAIR